MSTYIGMLEAFCIARKCTGEIYFVSKLASYI